MTNLRKKIYNYELGGTILTKDQKSMHHKKELIYGTSSKWKTFGLQKAPSRK